ncbi:MAG: hypothetical protein ACJ8HU_11030 [Chthoniobacterales bacterium]
MSKLFITLLLAIALCSRTGALRAEEATVANGGTLNSQDKSYQLKHVLAYETTIDDENAIVVVLSGQPVSAEKLKEARAEEKDAHAASFNRPYLKLEFTKAGALTRWSAGVGDTSLSGGSGNGTAELKIQDGRATGKASQPVDTETSFHSGFDVRFDTPLLAAGASLPPTKKPAPAANVKPSVTGTFTGNGKDGKIAFVSAQWREPFNDKPSIVLVFTEKDHSKARKPDFDAGFGKFGSALVISLHEDGGIFGCQVAHSAHQKQGFSSIGSISTRDFSFENGKVEGELTTDGQVDTFGEKWEVNLKFFAPLGEIPKEFHVAEKQTEKPAKQSTKLAAKSDDDDEAPKSSASELNVKELPLTKDASDVEYKDVVEHVLFKSKANVKAVCAEMDASLKAQGWTKDGSDLVTPASAILKRKRGEGALTIFVKPEGGGSVVKMFTEGLSWDAK